MVLWCPDWPVRAARATLDIGQHTPLALIEHGLVFACSPEARVAGVRRGLTLREAQFRCSDLAVVPYDPILDRRAFDPVLDGIEALTPGVAVVRPGTCAIRARGPVRYYGGEVAAAAALLDYLHGVGLTQARVGIADGPFAAEQAARRAGPVDGQVDRSASAADRILIVPTGGSAAFLAPVPVSTVVDGHLGTLLARLGVHTLGQFAALPAQDVHHRFGAAAFVAHCRASGTEREQVVPRSPTPVFERGQDFEPALDRIDQLSFALRGTADDVVRALREQTLVCTAVSILVTTEDGMITERSWRHPRWFTAADLIDRVRWQLQGDGRAGSGLAAGIVRVVLSPDRVDSVANHEDGLWGTGPDERIHHALTRVQGLVGHTGVVTAAVGGGRLLADRQRWLPWGDDAAVDSGFARPWAGSLDGVLPATVYRQQRPVRLIDAEGRPVTVNDRGSLDGVPAAFAPSPLDRQPGDPELRPVTAWAGPWPVQERWWDAATVRSVHRMQLVDATGDAWLLALADGGWRAEARYD